MGFNNVDVMVSGPNKPSSTYKTKILKGNHSFASQVTEANTKYVIKYDFNLNGAEITIPVDCVLEFDGGSIKNGKVIGNNTFLSGNITDDTTNLLSGSFLGNNGEFLNFDKLSFTRANVIKENFRYSDSEVYISGYNAASVCCDSNYIYQFVTNSNNDCYVLLFTKDFSYIGKSHITRTCHCNSCFLKDGVVYVTNMTDYVFYANASDIVYNCSNEGETDLNSISIASELHLYAIDYDPNNKVLYGFTGVRDDNAALYILNDDFSVSETLLHPALPVSEYISHFGINNIIYNNDYIIRNGLCIIGCGLGGNIETSTLNAFSNLIAVVDIYSNKLIHSDRFMSVQDFIESEGICYDEDNKDIIISAKAVNFREVRCNGLLKLQIGTNALTSVKQTSYTMYIDNTFTGNPLGSPANPYKTINEALCTNANSTDHLVLLLRYTGTPYDYYAPTTLRFKNIFIEGRSSTYSESQPLDSPVIINIQKDIELHDGTSLEFRGVELISDTSSRIILYSSTIVLNKCSLNVKIFGYLSNIYIRNGCIIHNYKNRLIDASISNIYCENSTIEDDDESNEVFALKATKMYITSCLINTKHLYSKSSINSQITLGGVSNTNTINGNFGGDYTKLDMVKVVASDSASLSSALSLLEKGASFNIQLFLPVDVNLNGQMYYRGLYYKRNTELLYVPLDNAKRSGTSENRPTNYITIGFQYFDTTLGKPIYWNGTAWVDATGATV